ncbi:hypothetical protein NDK43_30330 [Neobacillus pocheonensis]|uniref:Uncharacterized protein n=1 Tax=Neobacillus pocheonensis TaxID=363869 RepID=A0ABT0WJS2_9BACI|nr:hypothetical protein [Neobacillus pocheonensis]
MWRKVFNLKTFLITVSLLVVIGVIVWQGVHFQGNPDPTAKEITPGAAIINTAILVFREGLEAILVLSAIISGLVRKKQDTLWKPISIGGRGFLLSYGCDVVYRGRDYCFCQYIRAEYSSFYWYPSCGCVIGDYELVFP